MRVLNGSAGGLAVVLENQNVFQAAIFLQVKNAVAKSPEHIFDLFRRKRRECPIVLVGFYHYLVGSDTVHFVEHAFGLTIEITFNAERGKFVGYHADSPSRSIAL